MVIRVDVVEAALTARYGSDRAGRRVIALAPGGRPFDDALAAELAGEQDLTLLSGRYEGFDERVHEQLATDVVSIGPYVLSGGELAAMVVGDAVLRKLPGALGHEESALRSRSARRSRARRSIRTTPARTTGTVTRCPRSCSPATTRRCASGVSSKAGTAGGASGRPGQRARVTPSEPTLLPVGHRAFATIPARATPPFAGRASSMSGVIESIERAQLRRVPVFQAGDRVRVHFQVVEGTRRRTQVFEGVVIKRQGTGARETFTVRKQSFGVGVERTFPLHSPKIERIEVAARGDVRRAKLYYLRERVGRRARVRERRWTGAATSRPSSRARCPPTTRRARARKSWPRWRPRRKRRRKPKRPRRGRRSRPPARRRPPRRSQLRTRLADAASARGVRRRGVR